MLETERPDLAQIVKLRFFAGSHWRKRLKCWEFLEPLPNEDGFMPEPGSMAG